MFMEVLTLPSGALLGLACILTGSRRMQAFATNMADLTIKMGKVSLTLAQLGLTITTLRFVAQCFYVSHCQHKLGHYRAMQEEGTTLVTSEVEDKLKASVWRAERNFWITLFSLSLWLVFIRSSQVIAKLRHKIEIARVKSKEMEVKKAEMKKAEVTNTPPTEPTEVKMPEKNKNASSMRNRK